MQRDVRCAREVRRVKRKRVNRIIAALLCLVLLAGCSGNGSLHLADDMEEKEQPAKNMDLEAIYRIGLGSYINEKLGLGKYEKEIEEIGCLPVDAVDRGEAQMRDRTGLSYIYIRNNICTDILSAEEIETLKNCSVLPDGSLSEEAMEIIVNTYANAIRAKETVEGNEKMTVYDSNLFGDMDTMLVPVDALVLQIATQSEKDKDGITASIEKEDKKENALYELAGEMEEELKGKLGGVPVVVKVDRVE